MRIWCTTLAACVCVLTITLVLDRTSIKAENIATDSGFASHASVTQPSLTPTIYLPLIFGSAPHPVRRVNAPYFSDAVDNHMSGQAIFWFGGVTPNENYADVRVGYNDNELYFRVAVVDRRLWYNATNPAPGTLTAWDAVSIFLSSDGNAGATLSTNVYRFDAQPNWFEVRRNYAASYRGNSLGWIPATVPFTTVSSWRGNAWNDNIDDNGWVMEFHIPFASLGMSAPPYQTSSPWGLAVSVHNRNDAVGTPIPPQIWPESMNAVVPASWGQLHFGLPMYIPPSASPEQVTTIRNGLGMTVTDSAVGGHFTCGTGLEVWTQWGNANYAGNDTFNIQDEADISDWPCFSKYYVTFPLGSLPAGKAIISATLTLHQFGQAGAPGAASYSIIQVFTVAEEWKAATLTWNTAPLALENVGWARVDPVPQPCAWPCVPRTWDVSYAVAQAYASDRSLRLALYSGDGFYDSGKYFVSSAAADWNAVARPTLQVLWGDPK